MANSFRLDWKKPIIGWLRKDRNNGRWEMTGSVLSFEIQTVKKSWQATCQRDWSQYPKSLKSALSSPPISRPQKSWSYAPLPVLPQFPQR